MVEPTLKIPQAAPLNLRWRVSRDDVWPLRGVDGKTFAERKAEREEQNK